MPFTFFLDDSERMRAPTESFFGEGVFGMGGVIVPGSELCALEADIARLAKKTFGERIELKWHLSRSARAKIQDSDGQDACRQAMFEILAAHGCESIVTLIYDVRKRNSSVGRDEMRAFAFEPCLQRFQNHIDASGDLGPHIVVIDTPPDGPRRLHGKYRDIYENGAILPSGKSIKSGKRCGFASALCISDATHCLALQAADICVGCVVSWIKAEMTNLKKKDSDPTGLKYGREYVAQWLKVARKGPGGLVRGYGLVPWPRDENFMTVAMEVGLSALA